LALDVCNARRGVTKVPNDIIKHQVKRKNHESPRLESEPPVTKRHKSGVEVGTWGRAVRLVVMRKVNARGKSPTHEWRKRGEKSGRRTL